MFNTFKIAYGAGWRAGMCGQRYELHSNGLRYAVSLSELCPFKGRWQFLQRFFWVEGWHKGTMQSVTQWLNSRKGARS